MQHECRDRPIPIPAPGLQLTSLTHVEDVASMLAAVPGNSKAIGQSYNVCSDRTYTFDGVCRILAKAAGKEAKIVHYNPKDFSLKKGEGFPFRYAGTLLYTCRTLKTQGGALFCRQHQGQV